MGTFKNPTLLYKFIWLERVKKEMFMDILFQDYIAFVPFPKGFAIFANISKTVRLPEQPILLISLWAVIMGCP